MPDAIRHLKQAKSNKSFYEQAFQDGPFCDWQITVCFYTALHLIEAHFANTYGWHSYGHRDRDRKLGKMVQREPRKQILYDRYSDLYDMSIRARYDCQRLTLQNVREAKESLGIIANQLCPRM